MQRKIDPAEIASSFRVRKVGEEKYELSNGSTILSAEREAIRIRLKCAPKRLMWIHDDGTEDPFFVFDVCVVELNIGFSGDEGWSSRLADNCVFVIDGESLRHVSKLLVHVRSDEEFQKQKARLAQSRGKPASDDSEEDDEYGSPVGHATLTHLGDMPEIDVSECLEFSVGLKERDFGRLINDGQAGRITEIVFFGMFGGLSTGSSYEVPRDLILCAGQEIEFSIDGLWFEYKM